MIFQHHHASKHALLVAGLGQRLSYKPARSFTTIDQGLESSLSFKLNNGLQQGTVNPPVLFNIYISDILNLFGLNSDPNKSARAFADDLIVYIAGKKPREIEKQLETLVNKIHSYYLPHLETHNQHKQMRNNSLQATSYKYESRYQKKKNWKNFQIKISSQNVPHKRLVKYLGIHLDQCFSKCVPRNPGVP